MAGFKYEPVLRYRKFQEEKLQRELSETNRSLEAEKELLGSLENQLEDARRKFRLSVGRPVNSPVLLMHNRFLERLCMKIARQLERVEAAEVKCRQKRAQVVEALKNRKSLEKVKENFLIRQRALQKKLQGKFMDEIGVNKYIRRQSDGEDECSQ